MFSTPSIPGLLDDLAALQVELAVEDGKLRFRPVADVPQTLRSRLHEQRDNLMALLDGTRPGAAVSAADLAARSRAGVAADDPEWGRWSEPARETYIERLAIAADLGMRTGQVSEAERIARREARRVAAGFPDSASAFRSGDLFDLALEAFEPLGGLRVMELRSRPKQHYAEASKS